jgi:hypothetical protein
MTAQQICDLLNTAYKADPACVNTMFGLRRACSSALVDHPHVMVAENKSGNTWLTFMGLITGMLLSVGSDELVTAKIDEQGNVLGLHRQEGKGSDR